KLLLLLEDIDLSAEVEEVSLSKFLFQEISKIRHTFEKGLNIKYMVDLAEPFMVRARSEDISDLFRIMLLNAIKFTTKPKILSATTIESYNNSYWKISISDAGIGVPDENKEIIFLRFKKPSERAGSGVGLALAKLIVDKYQGKIWVEDRVKGDFKQGSSFQIALPKI
ncbi:MAG: sensor histidine kinase, partial [Candidatus Hodarchaeota archaeon]